MLILALSLFCMFVAVSIASLIIVGREGDRQ